MPVHFEFEGQHYEMPDGTTPDQAKAKIFKHLGREQAPAVEQKQEKRGVLNQGFRDALGGIEAAAGMVSALPSQVASGLEGLARLPFQGLDKATQEMLKTQEYRYHPRTESGKTAEEAIGRGMDWTVKYGSPVLDNLLSPITGSPTRLPGTDEGSLEAQAILGAVLNLAGPEGLIAARAGMRPKARPGVSAETTKGLEQFKKRAEEAKSATDYEKALADLDKTMTEVQAPQLGQKGGKVARPEGAEGKRQRTVADQEKFDADMREIMQGLDEQTLESVTAKLDEQQARSPYAQLETPPELARMNERFVDTPRTMYADEFGQVSPEQVPVVSSGADIRSVDQLRDLYAQNEGTPRQPLDVGLTEYAPEKPFQYPQEAMVDVPTGTRQVARGPFVPKSQRGVLDMPEIMRGLEEMAAKMKARGEEPVSTFEANASGESAASMEAINRLRQEQAAGQERYKVKANGEVVPLTTADRVDAQAYPGEVILQRGVGKDEWTVLDNNKGNAFAAKARLADIAKRKGQGGAFTPFSSTKKERAVIDQFKTFEDFYKSVPDELKDVAAEYWTANGGKLTGKDVTNPLASSKLGKYLEPLQANKSDLYEDNKAIVRQAPDITENAFRDVTMPEGASAKRWFNNPAITYAVNLINGGKKRAEIATKKQLKDIETDIGNITGFFGRKQELHDALTAMARGETPSTARGAKLKETWDKVTNELYNSVNEAWKARKVEQGLEPTDLPKIDNYFPHTWEGPWGFKVVDPTTGETISIVRQKTKADANKALEHFKKSLGDSAEFQLSDISYNRAYERSKFQQDLGIVRESFLEMLDVLGTADPVIQRKQQQLDAALGRQAWDTLNFKQRTKRRIGVEGFLGDQPWKSVKENATDALEVMTNYVRDANTFVEAQKSSKELRKFSEDLAATHPNTIKYAEKYYEKTYGGLENKLKVIDDVLEATGKAIGRSGSTFKDAAFSTKNFLTGVALGMWRPAYMLSNVLQAPISTIPELVRMTAMDRNVGVGSALMSGVAQAVMLPANKRLVQKGKKGLFISDDARKTFEYALKNDVIDPSIIETIDQVNPSIPKAVSDFIVSKSIRTTEQLGRMWAFSSLTKALKDAGYKLDDAHQIARDLTDITMLDLDKHNRPRMYQYMGLAGEFAGNLQTFKHNFYTQLVYDMKRSKMSSADKAALATKLGLVFASAGAMGIVGFREADEIVNFIKQNLGVALNDREMIESRTPSQWLMEEVPMEVSMGPLSSFIGADVSQSFASPVAAPESISSVLYPLGRKAVEMAQGAGEIGKGLVEQDRMKIGAGASKILPDTPFVKGRLEEEMLSRKLPSGNLAVENPRMGYGKVTERTPLQQRYRDVGLREINESMDKQLDYRLSQQERNINEAKQNIVNKIGEAMASYTINQRFNPEFKSKLGSLATKFVELGGDPEEFIRQAERIGMKRADTNIVTQEINKKLSNVRQQQKAQRRLESFGRSRENR